MATAPITRYVYFAWVSWRLPSTVGPAAHPRTHVYLLILRAILYRHHPCVAFFCFLLVSPEVALISIFSLQPKGPSLVARMVKNPPAMQETVFNPWVGKIPWRREWQPTPVFWPGEFHELRSLVRYSPWGCKESDTTERSTLSRFKGV